MRNLTIAAAAIAMATLITATSASAEYLGGGPRKQNGQCWKASKGSEGFGFWRACPQPASASASARNGRGRAPGQPGQPGIDGETRSGGSAYSGG